MRAFIHSRLAPFKHASFRRYFLVQTLSMIGTWSHDLARAWIVVEMMGKAAALGLLMLSVALPTLILILQGGVLVDKLEVRRLMMATRATLAVSAVTLAALTEFGEIQLWHLLVFGFLEGVSWPLILLLSRPCGCGWSLEMTSSRPLPLCPPISTWRE